MRSASDRGLGKGSTSVRPVALYAWVVRPAVHAIHLDSEQLVITSGAGSHRLPVSEVHLEVVPEWGALRRITVTTPQCVYTLGGVAPRSSTALVAAVVEAQRRERVRTSLQEDGPRYQELWRRWAELGAADRYLTETDLQAWLAELRAVPLPSPAEADLLSLLSPELQATIRALLPLSTGARETADRRNKAWVQSEAARFGSLLDTVERYPLTPSQREAVLHDEDNVLVLAGAGTGKTSTLVAKVGYLLRKGLARPEELLLLAFTRKAADELRERLKRTFSVAVPVRTFHSLGLEILAQAEGRKPSLAREAEDPAVKRATLAQLIARLLGDPDFQRDYLRFHTQLRAPYRPAQEFRSEAEYRDYLLSAEPRTFSGVLVRSYEECEIANWLLLNGIRFEYEHPYEVDTATREHVQYRPDFYLPDYGIYLEHWGVDRAGNPAPFMDREQYQAKMRWARGLHQARGTRLVETYSWERVEGVLLDHLELKLRERGVTFGSVPVEDALTQLNRLGLWEPFLSLVGTFLSLLRSAGSAWDEIRHRASGRPDAMRTGFFLNLIERIERAYRELLVERGEIDFDDMIHQAVDLVNRRAYRSRFRYLLVDELQDLSQGRARLLRGLRDQVPGAKLFCVGDDWQSIYRFTGSDLSLTTRFPEHFGYTRTVALERTFRFDDRLAAFSSRFVLRNPAQLPKTLTTHVRGIAPAVVLHLGSAGEDPLPMLLTQLAEAGRASVFVLNRYHFQRPAAAQQALRRRFPQLDLQFHSVHASKGLEADYVVVEHVASGRYGFPSEMADDPVLDLVLAQPDAFPHGEERRLFYVALTRARKRVYLLAEGDRTSPFIRELLDDPGYEKIVEGTAEMVTDRCPACSRGRLHRRRSPYGAFYGCTYYPLCEYKEQPCPACRNGRVMCTESGAASCNTCAFAPRVCPRCGSGRLVPRKRRTDGHPFLGCSRYDVSPSPCRYTESPGSDHQHTGTSMLSS